MLCSRFQQIKLNRVAVIDRDNVQCRCIKARQMLKQCQLKFFALLVKNKKEVPIMSVRFLIRDLGINRLRNVWTRTVYVSNVVKRYRRDRSVREVFLCFRQTFFRPRGTLLLSATAACQGRDDEDDEKVELPSCSQDITDEELQSMLAAFDGIEELSQTIFCPICNKRVMIDRRLSTIKYCTCKEASTPTISEDGWEPYVEAEDTIIWRKEYKAGQGLFAYKVYGRYKEVLASDYAAVNIDTAYRKEWDSAVADLSIVERSPKVPGQAIIHWEVLWPFRTDVKATVNIDTAYRKEWDSAVADLSIVERSPKVPGQAIIHWEVLWPRLFANRDYVYIRRHKEYKVKTLTNNPLEERPSKSATPVNVSNPNRTIVIILPKNIDEIPTINLEVGKPNEEQSIPEPKVTETKVPEEKAQKPKEERERARETTETAKVEVNEPPVSKPVPIVEPEQPSVHSNAKRKSQEMYSKMKPEPQTRDNKVYVILSKSCSHPKVPETRNAIRVTEYWSQMVVRSIEGAENAGMEFVLTYYDEPAVGGLPSGVSSWASGRAAPTYLDKMREAAKQYDAYRLEHGLAPGELDGPQPKPVSFREPETKSTFNEEDMESSKQGPELGIDKDDLSKKPTKQDHSKDERGKRNEATQTELFKHVSARTPDKDSREGDDAKVTEEDDQDSEEDEEESGASWWPNPFSFIK